MKKPSTLTLALLVLSVCGYQVASAWQGDAAAKNEKQDKSPQAASAEEVVENDPDAVALVQQARNRLFERQSVQAELAQIASLGNYTFRSTGAYAATTDFRYRLEYQVALGELHGNFLEVCDGQVLHTRRQISSANATQASTEVPEVELTRRDIQKIRREAMGLKDSLDGRDLASALRAAEIGMGGVPAILASLERSMIFDDLRQEKIEGREFMVVQGRWIPERRERLFAGLGGAAGQIAGLMPDLVRVYFARETLFPEKFLYLKQLEKDPNSYRAMLTVEFKNVVLDQPVPERLFVYVAPPGVEEKDDTAEFLEGLRQTAEPAAADATEK